MGWRLRGCRSWKTLDMTLNEDLFLRPSYDTTSRYFQRPNLTSLGMCEYFWTLVGQWLVSSTHMNKNARKTSLGTILFLWLKITYIQNQHQILCGQPKNKPSAWGCFMYTPRKLVIVRIVYYWIYWVQNMNHKKGCINHPTPLDVRPAQPGCQAEGTWQNRHSAHATRAWRDHSDAWL